MGGIFYVTLGSFAGFHGLTAVVKLCSGPLFESPFMGPVVFILTIIGAMMVVYGVRNILASVHYTFGTTNDIAGCASGAAHGESSVSAGKPQPTNS
jgi:hypothetical protein